jgi:hypothetical protein
MKDEENGKSISIPSARDPFRVALYIIQESREGGKKGMWNVALYI